MYIRYQYIFLKNRVIQYTWFDLLFMQHDLFTVHHHILFTLPLKITVFKYYPYVNSPQTF